MRVLLFGASGMVGQGVLRECLKDPGVAEVVSVGRSRTGVDDAKLHELLVGDVFDLSSVQGELVGFDACFFCLGVSSAGMTEEAYTRVTRDLTLYVARLLAGQNPGMVFVYVSGMGTDSTEKGRPMWVRVKGATENALLREPFRAVYLFRPGFIQPMEGVTSKTRLYRWIYAGTKPLLPLVRMLGPKYVTTTEEVGRAMLRVVRDGANTPVLESAEIAALGR
jgi:uncharacterized protein YbjT (DUF2867 family)